MRSLLLLLAFGSLSFSLRAQHPDVDAWMERHFSGKNGVKQDIKADEALYASLGLDSLRKNRFIGEVSGTIRLPDGSGPVQFALWTDTLEALLRFSSPGDTTTFIADLRTNTISIIQTGTEAGEVNTSISDLRERVVVNWYRYKDDGSPWVVHRRKPYDRDGGLLGQNMERWSAVKGDTVQFTRRQYGFSPFLDALEWMPYGGEYPFNMLMMLARAGDPMPTRLRSNLGTVDVTIQVLGQRPRPEYHPGANVTDTRTKTHHALPVRKRNTRASVLELDPVFTIPEGDEHGWATNDPGDPSEPQVTWTGTRSRMRVNAKQPCGGIGTVVVRVWIDRKGVVQLAEFDKGKSTLHVKACVDEALEAAKKDTFYPIEGGMPLDKGELLFEYGSARGGRAPVDRR